jgi:hypothetical protein
VLHTSTCLPEQAWSRELAQDWHLEEEHKSSDEKRRNPSRQKPACAKV